MNHRTMFVLSSLGLAVFSAGCQQQSGHAENTADTNRPEMASEHVAAADPATYTVPYSTTAETPWMQTMTDTTAAGTLHTGDTVYLRTDAPTTGIVSAKTADGRIVYVKAADLHAK